MYAGSLYWRDVSVHVRQARLVWAWHTAATLTQGTITRKDEGDGEPRSWHLTGTLGEPRNAFALLQRPLLLTVGHKLGFWTFPVRRMVITESRVFASLGPPEQG